MAKVIVVGDGPAGLSAALFLAKLEMDVTVFGIDKTSMHSAMLYNYLGIPEMTGGEFQQIARRQVSSFGADLQHKRVEGIQKTDRGFVVTTEDGAQHASKYVVLAEGKGVKLSVGLGLTGAGESVETGPSGQTSIERCSTPHYQTPVFKSAHDDKVTFSTPTTRPDGFDPHIYSGKQA